MKIYLCVRLTFRFTHQLLDYYTYFVSLYSHCLVIFWHFSFPFWHSTSILCTSQYGKYINVWDRLHSLISTAFGANYNGGSLLKIVRQQLSIPNFCAPYSCLAKLFHSPLPPGFWNHISDCCLRANFATHWEYVIEVCPMEEEGRRFPDQSISLFLMPPITVRQRRHGVVFFLGVRWRVSVESEFMGLIDPMSSRIYIKPSVTIFLEVSNGGGADADGYDRSYGTVRLPVWSPWHPFPVLSRCSVWDWAGGFSVRDAGHTLDPRRWRCIHFAILHS